MSHKAAESAGKIPDAREEARKIQAMKHARRGIAYAIADIQKRTLLAAAAEIRTGAWAPPLDGLPARVAYEHGVRDAEQIYRRELERRAEQIGRQG